MLRPNLAPLPSPSPNNPEFADPPKVGRDNGEFDITLRVGCSLAYEATQVATLLLNLRPWFSPHHEVVFQALALGNNLPFDEFLDSHGNQVCRVQLALGTNLFRHDAIVRVSSLPDNANIVPPSPGGPYLKDISPWDVSKLPPAVLRYTLPSRYCDSDKLTQFAWQKFGQVEHGWPRTTAISQWLHQNLEYRYLSGSPELSAWDVLQRGYGVCRDFAHLAIALNRSFNIPARYVTGHLADIGVQPNNVPMDFHAYAEVFLGGQWLTTDARFHIPRIGRVKLSCGQDAVDGAFSTIFGGASLTHFEVWAYQVARGTVGVGDPVDFAKRLDNQWTVKTDPT